MADPGGVAAIIDLEQRATVEVEIVGEAPQRSLDLGVSLGGDDVDQPGRQLRDQFEELTRSRCSASTPGRRRLTTRRKAGTRSAPLGDCRFIYRAPMTPLRNTESVGPKSNCVIDG